jgi:xanthine dehydrogenase YagS FAD-binding subunit
MKKFMYIYPKNVDSIPAILNEGAGKTLLYAGGTDALARLKEEIDKPDQIVNLKAVKELHYIKEEEQGVRIGATTPLYELTENKACEGMSGLQEAVKSIATLQLRNMGTVGGNLCQKPRCWYFRSRHFPCLRKHGEICYAIDGENKYHAILGGGPCFIVHPSDLAPMLIAFGARVTVLGNEGTKYIDLHDLYVLPDIDAYNETILSPSEIMTEIYIPKTTLKTHYLKFKERKSFDFALASVALAAWINNNQVSDVRIVLGGVAPIPWRAKKAEQVLEGQEIDQKLLEKAAAAELDNAEPLEKNEYKVILVKNLLKRAFIELLA